MAIASRRPGRIIAVLALCALPLTAGLAAQSIDPVLGREIFDKGRGRDGRNVIGRVAGGEVPMQGGAVACGNCHGARGAGGGEGWIEAPDIRWFALSKPYGARRAGGEARPPYDRDSFARALRGGTAPDGVPLDPAMPRFDLADDEIDALRSHLMRLSDEVHGDVERPALIVLMPKSFTPAADRLLRGLQSCPTASGAGTEVPQTLPALRVLRYGASLDVDAQLAEMASAGTAAALFAPYLVGAEDDFAHAGIGARLPVLLPMAMRDLGDDTGTAFSLPGLRAQARALIAAPKNPAENRLAIAIDAAAPGRDSLAAHLRTVAERVGWRVSIHDGVAAASPGAQDAVLALTDPGQPPPTLRRAPQLWVPAAFVTQPSLAAWTAAGASVRIALPYAPTVGADPHWIPPVDAWVAVGCELIARLPPLPQRREDVEMWRSSLAALPELRLGDWIRLPASSNDEDAASRVFTTDWPPPR